MRYGEKFILACIQSHAPELIHVWDGDPCHSIEAVGKEYTGKQVETLECNTSMSLQIDNLWNIFFGPI